MNNLKEYDEFVNEELNLKKLGKRINLEFTYAKAGALLGILKILLFWNKDARIAFDAFNVFMKRAREIGRFDLKYGLDDAVVAKMSDDEVKKYITDLAAIYEGKYKSSFVDDLKLMLNKILEHPEHIVGKPKKERSVNLLRKFIRILETDHGDHDKEDPYGEEEWEENEDYDIRGILRDGRRMSNEDFLRYTKEQLVGKTVLIIPEKGAALGAATGMGLAFKEKFKVADVELKVPNDKYKGVILIDTDGEWHIPSTHDPMKIL